MDKAAQRRLDVLSLASFVALGLPDGMLGTVWPSMRHSLHAPVGDLGLILLASTAGAVATAAVVGVAIRRLGVPALLAAGLACAAAAAAGFAVAPAIGVILAVAVLFGVAAGMMDGGLNTAIGLSGRRRLLNLLHAAYGVGTAIGPLVVTAAIVAGSWRPAYLLLLAADAVVAALWVLQRRAAVTAERRGGADAGRPRQGVDVQEVAGEAVAGHDPPAPGRDRPAAAQDRPAAAQDRPAVAQDLPAVAQDPPAPGQPGPRPPTPLTGRRYQGAVIAGIAVFFVYTGLEVAAGQWETTFSRGHLHLSPSEAGLATFGYWAALTSVRLGLGVLPRPLASGAVVRWGSGVAVLAAALIWWQPATGATVAGFVVLGGALAGVYPALVDLTPTRLGADRAQHVIAWQVGAAAAGGAALSALVGLLIAALGLGVLGPAITALAVVLIGVEVTLRHLAPAVC